MVSTPSHYFFRTAINLEPSGVNSETIIGQKDIHHFSMQGVFFPLSFK